jgi:small redox-active disulfide protein 2
VFQDCQAESPTYVIKGDKMLTIKVLGSGCSNCKRVEQIVHKVVEEMSVEAEVIKVTEYPDIMAYNIMSTPGLVINEKVVSTGRIPTPAEVTAFVTQALTTVELDVLNRQS